MADGFIVGLVVATGGAVVSGFAVQFFTYYRERRNALDELLDTLRWIQSLDGEDWEEANKALSSGNIDVATGGLAALRGRHGYYAWRLGDRLYDAYEETRPQLSEDARKSIQELFRWYIAVSQGKKGWGADTDRLELGTEEATVEWDETACRIAETAQDVIDDTESPSVTSCFRDFLPWF